MKISCFSHKHPFTFIYPDVYYRISCRTSAFSRTPGAASLFPAKDDKIC